MSVDRGAGHRSGAGGGKAGVRTGAPGVASRGRPADAKREDRSLVALFGESPFAWAAALYRSIVDTSPDAITVTSVDGKILLCNRQAARLHGFERVDEMVGRSAWEFVSSEDRARALEDFGLLAQAGRVSNVGYTLQRADGGRVPVELSASAILDAEGNTKALIGVVRDVTGRKQAEEALRRSEEYFRSLTENAPDLITVIVPSGEISYQSPSVEHALGYTAEELTGTSIWGIIHPEDARLVGDAIARGILQRELYELIVFRARHKEGGWRYLEGTGKVLTQDGRPYGVINSRDITERIEAARALEESQHRKAAILETALDAIITIDDGSRVLEFNPAAEAMFGYTAGEAMGRSLDQLIIPPSLRAKHRLGIKRYLESGEAPILGKRIEMTAIRADGSEFPVEIAIVPIHASGPPVFTGYVRDLTERRRWEEELQQAREELESEVERRLDAGQKYGLTFREHTVLHLVASGKSDKEIGVTLGISSQTVNKHVARILQKMNASSRTEAGVRAIKDRVVE